MMLETSRMLEWNVTVAGCHYYILLCILLALSSICSLYYFFNNHRISPLMSNWYLKNARSQKIICVTIKTCRKG